MLAVGSVVRLRLEVLAQWRPWGFEGRTTGQVVAILWQRGQPAWVVVDWGEPLRLVSHVRPQQLVEVQAAVGSLKPGGVA